MLISIIYVISVIFLLVTFLSIKKSDKKQNILLWFFISIMLLFCYNTVIVYLLSFMYVHSTLLTLSLVNIFVTILLSIFIFKNRNIQKYYVNKIDILAITILAILVIIIGYLRFGFPFKIVYETVDPGTHFWTSMDFFRESILLDKAETAVDFSARVFGSYTNVGITFKILYPIVGYIDLYAVYIGYDLFMLFMSGIIFYFFIRYLYKDTKFWFILIGSIIYLTGYPLNNMIFGFFYSGHVVTLFSILILMFKFLDNKELNEKNVLVLITLLNIGICFTYYLYTPILIVAEIGYFIYKFKYIEKFDVKGLIKKILLIILLPIVPTIMYFFIPYIGVGQHSIFYQLNIDGYFYNSYFSNFLLFIPLILYYLINMLKNKKINFEICLFLLIVSIVTYIIYLSTAGLVLQYYSSKFFYMLWLLCFILLFDLFKQNDINKQFVKIYIGTFIATLLFTIFHIEDKLYDKNEAWGNRISSTNLLNVYSWNIDKMKYSNITFTLNELRIIDKLYEIEATNVIDNFIQTFNARRLWLNAFFWNEKLDYPENEVYGYMIKDTFFDPLDYDCYWDMDHRYKYFVVFYRDFDEEKWSKYHDIYPFEVQRRWDVDFRKDYTINKKELYDEIDRTTCLNCKFIDFNDGMIIIDNNGGNKW